MAATFGEMFVETRCHKGFRNIRLLRSDIEPNHFILIEEWDTAQDFYDYADFRVERGDTEMLMAKTATPPQTGIWDLTRLAGAES